MTARIFISYSRKDKALCDEFVTYLKTFEQEGLLSLFIDTRVGPARDWNEDIQNELNQADIVVGLVSQNFVASDYIRHHEMPQALARAEARGVAVTALYLRSSTIDDDDGAFLVPLDSGEKTRIKLTKYSGLNDKATHVESFQEDERAALLTKAATDLKDLAKSLASRGPVSAGLVRSSRVGEITATLKRINESVAATYHAGGGNLRVETHAPLADVIARWEREGPAACRDAAFTDALFDVLFGSDEQRALEVVRFAVGRAKDSTTSPVRDPLRVRIETDDDVLLQIPWTRTTWKGQELRSEGWSFELWPPNDLADHDGGVRIRLRTPTTLLALIPRSEEVGAGFAARHENELAELCHALWPDHHDGLVVARDFDSLPELFRRHRPDIVYYFGPAVAREKRLHLGESAVNGNALTRLESSWHGAAPRILFLNLFGRKRRPATLTAAESVPDVPLLCSQTWAVDPAEAGRSALSFFHSVLAGEEDTDPVMALNATGLETTSAWSQYSEWRTLRSILTPALDLVKLLLDRRPQGNEVKGAIDELVRTEGRSVCSLLAFGDPQNHVEAFGTGMLERLLRDRRDVANFRRVSVSWPEEDVIEPGTLEQHLRMELRLDPRMTLGEGLAALRSRAGSSRRPVIILDVGPWIPAADHSPNALQAGLEAWVSFCSSHLSTDPRLTDVHVLAILAVELPAVMIDGFAKAAKRLRRSQLGSGSRSFRLEVLPPLGDVEEEDLIEFFTTPGYSSCPDNLVEPISELIHEATGGRFAPTVALIEKAERIRYLALKAELESKGGSAGKTEASS